MARSLVPSVVQKLREEGVFDVPRVVCWRRRIWRTVLRRAVNISFRE